MNSQNSDRFPLIGEAALIERLEKATGPDRELDWTIWFETAKEPSAEWPLYTSSIDAALTLVPAEYDATINTFCWVELNEKRMKLGEFCHRVHVRHSKQAAIAICIAALKARACIAASVSQ